MGTLYTNCRVANMTHRDRSASLDVLVDTGSEYIWINRETLDQIGVAHENKDRAFTMANGKMSRRSVGFAVIHVADTLTVDEVVFAETGDLQLLGARTLEGLNLKVDADRKQLIAAGPAPAAAASDAEDQPHG